MNQAHNNGRYYEEDFEPKRAIPWMAILGAVVISSVFIGLAAVFADHNGFERGRAYQQSLATPTCPASVATDPFKDKSCAEVATSCYSQKRMERVKRLGA